MNKEIAHLPSIIDWKVVQPNIMCDLRGIKEDTPIATGVGLRVVSSFPKVFLNDLLTTKQMEQLTEDYVRKTKKGDVKSKLFQIIVKLQSNLFLSKMIFKEGTNKTPTKNDIDEGYEADKILNEVIQSLETYSSEIGDLKFIKTSPSSSSNSNTDSIKVYESIIIKYIKLMILEKMNMNKYKSENWFYEQIGYSEDELPIVNELMNKVIQDAEFKKIAGGK